MIVRVYIEPTSDCTHRFLLSQRWVSPGSTAAGKQTSPIGVWTEKKKWWYDSRCPAQAWCWPELGLCIHHCMQKRQATGFRLARTIWTLSRVQLYMLDVCLACLDGFALCPNLFEVQRGGAKRGLTPEIQELLNRTEFSLSFPHILTCLSRWVGRVCSPAPSVPKEQLFWLHFHVVKAKSQGSESLQWFAPSWS